MEVHNRSCDFTLYFGINIDFQMIISVITVVGTLFGLVVPTGTCRSAVLLFIATALTAILPPPPHNRPYFPLCVTVQNICHTNQLNGVQCPYIPFDRPLSHVLNKTQFLNFVVNSPSNARSQCQVIHDFNTNFSPQ